MCQRQTLFGAYPLEVVPCECCMLAETAQPHYCIHSGRSCLSPCGDLLAIHNIASGFDLYHVKTAKLIRTYPHQSTHHVALPVLFIHGGKTLLTGSDVGLVRLYDLGTTLPVDRLKHGEHYLLICTSALSPQSCRSRDRHRTSHGMVSHHFDTA